MPPVPDKQGKRLRRVPCLYIEIRFLDHQHEILRGVSYFTGPVKAVQFFFELDGYIKFLDLDSLYKLKR